MIKQIVIIVLCVGIYDAKLSSQKGNPLTENSSISLPLDSLSLIIRYTDLGLSFSANLALFEKRKALAKVNRTSLSLFQVKHNGSFALKMCYASTEYCLCADKRYNKPFTSLSRNIKSCECFGERHEASRKMEKVGFVPQCEADGFYKAQQYYLSGFLCVDKHGTNLTESSKGLQYCKCLRERHEKETNKFVGEKMKRDLDGSNCTCLFEKYLVDELIDVHIPTCDEDGNYSAMQCHKQYCWCTGTDGRIFNNMTKVPKNQLTSEKCNCYRRRQAIIKWKLPVERPNCEGNNLNKTTH